MRCYWCDEKILANPVKVGVDNWHLVCLQDKQRMADNLALRMELQDYESDLRDEEDSA